LDVKQSVKRNFSVDVGLSVHETGVRIDRRYPFSLETLSLVDSQNLSFLSVSNV
jgi:hypothetical protein